MASDGTKINSELNVNPEEIVTFPGIMPAEKGKIFYTIRTFEPIDFAKELGVLYYKEGPIFKLDIKTGEQVLIPTYGNLTEKFDEKNKQIKELHSLENLPYDTAKNFVEYFIEKRSKIKRKFISDINEARKEQIGAPEEDKHIYGNVIIALTDKYKEDNDQASIELEDFKVQLKNEVRDNNLELILDHLEVFNNGLFIGRNPACDFPIDDKCVSNIQGIISEKDNKIVYKDLGLNMPLIYTFKNTGKGLVKYVDSNGERLLIDKNPQNHQAAIIFLGNAIRVVPKEKETNKTVGMYSKYYICIARR